MACGIYAGGSSVSFLHIRIRKHSSLIDAERDKPPFCLIIGYGREGGRRYQTGRPCGSACKYDTNNCFSNSEVQALQMCSRVMFARRAAY